jgi:RimJ/RimL family protein N-acetyltransferase
MTAMSTSEARNREDELRGSSILLREKRWEDAERDYRWKSDPEIARLDATLPVQLSFHQFQALQIYHPPVMDWASKTFAIDTLEGEHIGNCMYYNLDRYAKTVEIGIIIGESQCWNKGYGTEALRLLVRYVFEELRLRRIYLHTLEWNVRAQRAFEKCGFLPSRRRGRDGYLFLVMELDRREWERRNLSEAIDEEPRDSATPVADRDF